jgi:diguanylate cyclase (GGDEF)-like protein
MPHDLTAQPVHEMLAALRDALDAIDCGIVLFAPDMRVRFANRRFAELRAVAREVLVGQSFRDLFGQATADPCRAAPHDAVRAHIQQREAAIRAGTVASSVLDLDDGRRLLFRCIPSADEGRILTCTDITWMRQREDQQHVARDAAERTEVEFRFNKETLEDQASYLVSLAEESDANARRAEQARHQLEREIAGRRQLEADLRRLATTDALTGTLNRRRFFELGQRKLSRGPDIRQEIAVLMVDIDHFKLINDRHGHPVGDEALMHVVRRLRSALRRFDLIGRLGGEEFAIMLPAITTAAALNVAERLRAAVAAEPLVRETMRIPMTISVGLAMARGADSTIEQMIARADEQLYKAKDGGRDRVCHSEPDVPA